MNKTYFPAAPLCTLVKVLTVLTYAILLFVAVAGLANPTEPLVLWYGAMIGLPLAFGAIGPLFVVKGYTLEHDALIVHRAGWVSRIPLSAPVETQRDPEAMKGALRLCGNGGLFCFSGWFRSRKLGKFRPFVTDPERSVIVRTGGKTWVISPADPEAFAAALDVK